MKATEGRQKVSRKRPQLENRNRRSLRKVCGLCHSLKLLVFFEGVVAVSVR